VSAEGELAKIVAEFGGELTKLKRAKVEVAKPWPSFMEAASAGTFKRLSLEAEALLNQRFGVLNQFTVHLYDAVRLTEQGRYGRTVLDVAIEAHAVLVAALNHVRREPMIGPTSNKPKKPLYVDTETIGRLGSLTPTAFDLSRLIQMCRELNTNWENDCYLSVISLVRAIIDHVPPLFGKASFKEVANQMPQSKKKSVLNLDASSRNIADSALHQHIRRHDSGIDASQVNFSQDLSVLLGEVMVVAKGS
jgi:hypothetical protein